jgi:CBS domain containing-hemolysin-like protein
VLLPLWSEILLLVVLLGLSAFFSSSETSLFSLSRLQLEQLRRDQNPRSELLQRMLGQPRRLIVTILIGNELVNVTASALSAVLIIHVWGQDQKWLNLVIMVPALLLFGEITPKALAIRNNVAFACFQAQYLDWFAKVIMPVRWTVRHIADYFTTLLTGTSRSPASIVTEDMVRVLTREGVGEGEIDENEAKYIDHIFEFGDTTLRDIMTPRSQIFSLPASSSLEKLAHEVMKTHHTKVPIYSQNSDAIVGVLFARDLLGFPLVQIRPEENHKILFRLLRKPYFVPESKLAADLFHTFRKRHLSIAFTVDEFGGLTGMVTMEDLLECIFGEIPSRSEVLKEETVGFTRLGPNEYRIDGAMSVKKLQTELGLDLPDEGVETLGGLLLSQFRELPAEGDQIAVENVLFVVTSVAERRIQEVIARLKPTRDADGSEPGSASPATGGE